MFRKYNKTNQFFATGPLEATNYFSNVVSGGGQSGGGIVFKYPDTPTNCDTPVMGYRFLKGLFDKLYENLKNNGKRMKESDVNAVNDLLTKLEDNEKQLIDYAQKIDEMNQLFQLNPDYQNSEVSKADLDKYKKRYDDKLKNTNKINEVFVGILEKLVFPYGAR